MTFQAGIHPVVKTGHGIILDHAAGIVVGETTVTENNILILQSATFGGTGKSGGNHHLRIREGVMIDVGVKIPGNIEVGCDAKIGAGSAVLQPVPPHTTTAGIPARIVSKPDDNEPSMDMDQYLNGTNHTFEYRGGI